MKELRIYIHVRELKTLGFSKRKTAQLLAVHRATINKYWDLTTEDYTANLGKNHFYVDKIIQLWQKK